MKKYLRTTITRVEMVAKGYGLLEFQCEEPLSGRPGQFVMIRGNWSKNPVLPRAFSIVQAGLLGQVLVRDVGPGTHLLVNMQKGDELFVTGPLGNGYAIDDSEQTAVLVAGGVGVAPLLFAAAQFNAAHVPVRFYYGARTADDLPLADEIGKLADLTITTEDGSVGEKGLITAPLGRDLPGLVNPVVYSCGPHGMLAAVARSTPRGIPVQVALESPMACGMGTCKGCAVVAADGSFRYVCTDGPVFLADDIFGGENE